MPIAAQIANVTESAQRMMRALLVGQALGGALAAARTWDPRRTPARDPAAALDPSRRSMRGRRLDVCG